MYSKIILLLLFITISVQTHKKLDNILKNVGKRYIHVNQLMTSMIISRNHHKSWMEEPDEYVAGVKLQIAERLTHHIRWQSSIRNINHLDHAKILIDLQDDDMEADVCKAAGEMNKFQFNNYLKRSRGTFYGFKPDATYSYEVIATTKDVLEMITTFDIDSQWGYKSTVIWNIKAKLVCEDNRCIYKIHHVTILGGCTEHGTVNHNFTEMGVRKDALKQLKGGANPDVQYLFDIFTPGSLMFREDQENRLPYLWLKGLDTNEHFLRLRVCSDDEALSGGYSREGFRSWYGRFSQMWHPKEGDKEFMKVQILNLNPAEIVARVTMKLQIGANGNATVREWDMKLVSSYNQHNDEKWYITRVEVLCQPHINCKDESYLAYPELVGTTFMSYVTEGEQWHNSMDFARHFIKRKEKMEFESCGTKIQTIEQLPTTFLVQGDLWNATMIGYMLLESHDSLPAKDEVTYVMRTVMNPPVKHRPEPIFGSDWEISIRWDGKDQFYYIYKMVFGCPGWMDKKGWWNVQPKKPCRTLCNFIRLGGK